MPDPTAVAQSWKQKYYDRLELNERKEKEWLRMEDVLRKAISRLTLAADGRDKQLDKHLQALRDAIRDHADAAMLKKRIEAMSVVLVKLDEAGQRGGAGVAEVLGQLLEQLQLPEHRTKALKKLRKQLQQDDSAAAMKPVAAFINQSLSTGAADTPAESGLFGRLFQRGGGDTDKVEPVADKAAQIALEPLRNLLLELIDHCALFDADANALTQLRTRAAAAASVKELGDVSRQVPNLITAPGVRSSEQAQPQAEAASESPPSDGENVQHTPSAEQSAPAATGPGAAEVLRELIQLLDLPEELNAEVASFKDRLDRELRAEEWPDVISTVADWISGVRSQLQREKTEIEHFLTQLTDRLQDLDQHVRGAETLREDSYQSGQHLDAAVQEQVRGIESSVRQAGDLEQLKTQVQDRLDNILDHLNSHRENEQQRYRQAEEEVGTLRARMGELEQEAEELRNRVRKEREQSLTDALTRIPNRLAYDERVEQELARFKRFNTPLSLLVWDIDRFKRINDEYGHKAGDKVLSTVARVLHEHIRETDFLARYGGEEFVLIMTGADEEAVVEVANKLRSAVAACGFHFRGEDVPVTISCGIAGFAPGETPAQVFERADQALYKAKQNGRNRCERASGA